MHPIFKQALAGIAPEPCEPMCPTCMGNGELVTDWERYMHGPLDENGNDAVEDCPDCNGTGHGVDEAQSKAAK